MKVRGSVSRIGLAAASLALASGLTLAQDLVVGSAPAAPSSFGPNTAVYSIPVDAFSPVDSATSWNFDVSSFARYRTGGVSGWFDAPVNLPSGAHIDGVAIEVYDNDAAYEISSWLGIHVGSAAGTNANFVNAANTFGTPGWTYVTNLNVNVTVDNLNNAYFIQVNLYTTPDCTSCAVCSSTITSRSAPPRSSRRSATCRPAIPSSSSSKPWSPPASRPAAAAGTTVPAIRSRADRWRSSSASWSGSPGRTEPAPRDVIRGRPSGRPFASRDRTTLAAAGPGD